MSLAEKVKLNGRFVLIETENFKCMLALHVFETLCYENTGARK